MKQILYSLGTLMILVITITTCKKDRISTFPTDIEETPSFTIQSHIDIDKLANWLPEAYFNGESKAIFVNKMGLEKKLNIFSVKEIKEKVHNGQAYTTDSFVVRLRDDNDITFVIDIDGYAIYGQENNIEKNIFTFLMPGNESGSMGIVVRFNENGPKVTMFDIFNDEVSFLGHTYKDVFKGGSTLGLAQDSFAEIAINAEVGIVYFRDRVNDLWVFDRFE